MRPSAPHLLRLETRSTSGRALTGADLHRSTGIEHQDISDAVRTLQAEGLIRAAKFRDLDGTLMGDSCSWVEDERVETDAIEAEIQRRAEEQFPTLSGPHALTIAMRETYIAGARRPRDHRELRPTGPMSVVGAIMSG